VAGLDLLVLPTVFHPKIFLTSAFFAEFLQSLELSGKRVAEIGMFSFLARSRRLSRSHQHDV
jgi:hypothetical protein